MISNKDLADFFEKGVTGILDSAATMQVLGKEGKKSIPRRGIRYVEMVDLIGECIRAHRVSSQSGKQYPLQAI